MNLRPRWRWLGDRRGLALAIALNVAGIVQSIAGGTHGAGYWLSLINFGAIGVCVAAWRL